jgi:hypothetical protein
MVKQLFTFSPHEDGRPIVEDGKAVAYVEEDAPPMTGEVLAAAYNAFDSAAKKLGVSAVELAEAIQDGQIADLIRALQWYQKNLTDHLDAPAFNALMKLGLTLTPDSNAKVNGGAS